MSEGVLRSVVESISALIEENRRGTQQLRETISEVDRSVGAKLNEVAVNLGQLTVGIKEVNRSQGRQIERIDKVFEAIDRLTASIERQNIAIDGHLELARQQGQTAEKMIELVATQSATISRLFERAS